MSQPLSSILERLSYTGPNLASLASYSTIKRQILEFASLNLSFNSDQKFDLVVYFSDDGDNFDITVPFSYDPATSNGSFSTPCLGAWTVIKITNIGGVTTSNVRLYVYGSISNSVTTAVFQTGGNTPHVIIDSGEIGINSPSTNFGEIVVDNFSIVPGSSLCMQNCLARSSVSMSTSPSTYTAGLVYSETTSASETYWATSRVSGALTLDGFAPATAIGTFGRFYNLTSCPSIQGLTQIYQFAASFRNNYAITSPSYYGTSRVGFGKTNLTTPTGAWSSGYSLGNGQPVAWGARYASFQIGIVGSSTSYIYQNSFNIDVLDGSGSAQNPSGMNLDTSDMNIYRMIVSYYGCLLIKFQVFSPLTHEFITFHILDNSNSQNRVDYPVETGHFIMDLTLVDNSSTTINLLGVNVSSFSMLVDKFPLYKTPSNTFTFNVSIATALTLTPMFALYNPETFNGKLNNCVAQINNMYIYNSSTQILAISTFKNNTYSAPNTYSNIDSVRSPIQQSYAGNLGTVSNVGVSNYSYIVPPTSHIKINFDALYISSGEDLLFQGILASGSASTCFLSINLSQYI